MTYEPFDLTGKVALITGGNGGIGLGFAEAVAKAGANVCIWGTNKDKNTSALEKLKAYGTQVSAFICNVADEEQVESCFKKTLDDFGAIAVYLMSDASMYHNGQSFCIDGGYFVF